MKINIVIYISPPNRYGTKFWFSSHELKCCQPIKLQDFLKFNISREKWAISYFWHSNKHRIFLQNDTTILGVRSQSTLKVPKIPEIRSLHIFAICPKNMGSEVYLLPADKHESFPQVGSIALGVRSQAYPNCPK